MAWLKVAGRSCALLLGAASALLPTEQAVAGALQASDAPVQTAQPGPATPTTTAGEQAALPKGADGNVVHAVTVTGSRIRRTDLTSTQPVGVITGQDIQDRGFTNLADVINQLPGAGDAIRPSGDQNDFGTGRNYINLFDLGTNRTLTLVNGRRFVSDNPTNIFGNEAGGQVDINTLPTLFVDRVEAVAATGAAVYGSDAIAGVVNIILKQKYEGLEITGQTGISAYGDAPRYTVEAAAGHTFLNGKLNLAIDFQYDRTNALLYSDRPRTASQYAFVPNPADTGPADGIPGTILIRNDRFAGVTVGGLPFTTRGQMIYLPGTKTPAQFGPDGNLIPFNPGTLYGGGLSDASGGDSLNLAPDVALQTPLDRKVFTAMANYDVTSHVRLHAQVFYSNNGSTEPANQPNYSAEAFNGDPPYFTGLNTVTPGLAPLISADNAFLSPQAKSVLAADGVKRFLLSRSNTDLTPSPVSSNDQTYDAVLDLEGDFRALGRDFTWSAAYTRGSSWSRFDEYNFLFVDPNSANAANYAGPFAYALNSVIGPNGQPACAITLKHPHSKDPDIKNCVPLDPFGANNASAAAISYVTDNFGNSSYNQQDDGQLNFGGTVIKLPAGEWKFSLGYEYRREAASFTPDAASAEGLGYSVPIIGQSGAYETNEYYAETLAPILGPGFNFPLAYKLEFEGAYRKIQNSLAGYNEAWSFGGRYSPTQDVTFRGSRSKTFRAPAITELFSSGTPAYDSGADPCQVSNITAGPNPAVRQKNCATAFSALGANLASFTDSIVGDETIPVNIGGNPDLKNETGSSWTYGVVLTPRIAPGLSMTADYIHIDITDAIEFAGIGDLLEQCYDSPSYPDTACGQFKRNSTGQVTTANETYINAGYSRYAGAQYAINYDRALAQLPFVQTTRDLGRIGVSFQALNTRRILTSDSGLGFDTIDYAGVIPTSEGGGTSGQSRWKAQLDVRYSYGPFEAGWITHYIGPAKYNLTYTIENQNILEIDPYFDYDLSLAYKITPHITARLNIDNITDAQPPYPVSSVSTYDLIGRYFLLSLDGKF